MARRGIANWRINSVDRSSDHVTDKFWREVFQREGAAIEVGPPRLASADCGRTYQLDSPDRGGYIGMETAAQDSARRPWDSARGPRDPSCRTWHPSRVLTEAATDGVRAGKSSWHHNIYKHHGRRVNVLSTTSTEMTSERHAHHTALPATPRRNRGPLDASGFAGRPREPAQAHFGDHHQVTAMGFKTTYHPRIC